MYYPVPHDLTRMIGLNSLGEIRMVITNNQLNGVLLPGTRFDLQ